MHSEECLLSSINTHVRAHTDTKKHNTLAIPSLLWLVVREMSHAGKYCRAFVCAGMSFGSCMCVHVCVHVYKCVWNE